MEGNTISIWTVSVAATKTIIDNRKNIIKHKPRKWEALLMFSEILLVAIHSRCQPCFKVASLTNSKSSTLLVQRMA